MSYSNRPFFMTNKEWYYFDDDEGIIKLTDKAPPEAVASYNEFYKETDPIIEIST